MSSFTPSVVSPMIIIKLQGTCSSDWISLLARCHLPASTVCDIASQQPSPSGDGRKWVEETSDGGDPCHCNGRQTSLSGHTWEQRALPNQVRHAHKKKQVCQCSSQQPDLDTSTWCTFFFFGCLSENASICPKYETC